jgi:CRISPR-associated protein Cas1
MRRDVYIIETGSMVQVQNDNLVVKRKQKKLIAVPLLNIKRLYLKGTSLLSSHLVLKLLNQGVDIIFLSFNGNFLTKIPALPGKNIELRKKQYRLFDDENLRSTIASSFVKGKIWNSYILMKRYMEKHKDSHALNKLLFLYNQLEANDYRIETLMGKEGAASQAYFSALGKIFKGDGTGFTFTRRTRRPPKDPLNAMLSFGYTLLFNEVLLMVEQTGLDPYLGYLHGMQYGRPSLALDIMEEFRPVIVDTLVINLVNKKMIKENHFVGIDDQGKNGVYLAKEKIKEFIYQFNYRMETRRFSDKTRKEESYRNIIQNQVYELIRFVEGKGYRPFRLKR